jgi:hypothetical protein
MIWEMPVVECHNLARLASWTRREESDIINKMLSLLITTLIGEIRIVK